MIESETKVEVIEVPETEEEFNEWSKTHSNLSRRMVTKCTNQLGTFGVKSINYFGNSVIVYELEKDPIFLDQINNMLLMEDGTKVKLYKLSDKKVAFISLDTYCKTKLTEDEVNKRLADRKSIIDAFHSLDCPSYSELNYVKSRWESDRNHSELDTDEWQVLINELTDKIWSH